MTNAPKTAVEGAWSLESYARQSTPAAIKGVLLFVAGHWSTLYFVPQSDNQYWASAEVGRYQLLDDQLTFHHDFTFQGGAGKQLLIEVASDVRETCGIAVTPDKLEIHFPSGNVIHCRRDSR